MKSQYKIIVIQHGCRADRTAQIFKHPNMFPSGKIDTRYMLGVCEKHVRAAGLYKCGGKPCKLYAT